MILHLSAALLVGSLFFAGCSDVSSCETCPIGPTGGTSTGTSTASTGPSCTQTTGTLTGTVSLFEPPGGPNSSPSPQALIELRRAPEDAPLLAMAGSDSRYAVDLPAGMWIVGGESADTFCTTFQPRTVTIEACGTTTHDLVLEACVN